MPTTGDDCKAEMWRANQPNGVFPCAGNGIPTGGLVRRESGTLKGQSLLGPVSDPAGPLQRFSASGELLISCLHGGNIGSPDTNTTLAG